MAIFQRLRLLSEGNMLEYVHPIIDCGIYFCPQCVLITNP